MMQSNYEQAQRYAELAESWLVQANKESHPLDAAKVCALLANAFATLAQVEKGARDQ